MATLEERVIQLAQRYLELEQLMAQPENASNMSVMETLGREYRSLDKNMAVLDGFLQVSRRINQAQEIIESETDPDMLEMAREELTECKEKRSVLEKQVKVYLVPKDPDDFKNALVEIRAGTGGIEAGIFAADLYRMYSRYAELRGWPVAVLSSSYGDLNSIKEVSLLISGDGIYGELKHESGVHRVQRIPQTESQGRIHTSAASVVVLPEASELDVEIDPDDLRIDVYRASGAGGQHVNKTESAVRIVHIPTGIVVTCQDEKSQHKNKSQAMKVLQSRLYDLKQAEQTASQSASRRTLIGSGDRSAKIRTYNFPQGRVTDHRINLTLYRLEEIINGDLQELTGALMVADMNERIKHAAN